MKPTVYLAMPCEQRPYAASVSAAYHHATDGRLAVKVVIREGSLLGDNFNRCWCDFLKEGFDYFALLHADVAPSLHFLDKLIEALGQRFAVMHAPCMIKDRRDLTSTAVGDMALPFSLCRRLTMAELFRLPPTFGYREVASELRCHQDGWCLLPNTGCMVIDRKRFPAHVFPGFEIGSKVVRDAAGSLESVVEPEDWGFGRWCARNGVQVGGTTRVSTKHYGTWHFDTDAAAFDGWDKDRDYFKAGGAAGSGVI